MEAAQALVIKVFMCCTYHGLLWRVLWESGLIVREIDIDKKYQGHLVVSKELSVGLRRHTCP